MGEIANAVLGIKDAASVSLRERVLPFEDPFYGKDLTQRDKQEYTSHLYMLIERGALQPEDIANLFRGERRLVQQEIRELKVALKERRRVQEGVLKPGESSYQDALKIRRSVDRNFSTQLATLNQVRLNGGANLLWESTRMIAADFVARLMGPTTSNPNGRSVAKIKEAVYPIFRLAAP